MKEDILCLQGSTIGEKLSNFVKNTGIINDPKIKIEAIVQILKGLLENKTLYELLSDFVWGKKSSIETVQLLALTQDPTTGIISRFPRLADFLRIGYTKQLMDANMRGGWLQYSFQGNFLTFQGTVPISDENSSFIVSIIDNEGYQLKEIVVSVKKYDPSLIENKKDITIQFEKDNFESKVPQLKHDIPLQKKQSFGKFTVEYHPKFK